MNEQVPVSRGLEDISHYFLTEKREATPEKPETVVHNSQNVLVKNLFLLGGESKEARAVLASNLACEWSLSRKDVELIEEHTQIQNSHFFIGGFSQNNGAGTIALTKWEAHSNLFTGKGEWVIWNLNFASVLKLLPNLNEAPLFLVVIEQNQKKLIQTYLEVKTLLKNKPDAQFIAVRYTNQPESKSQSIFQFFQQLCRRYLNIEVRDGGQILKDVSLAQSILKRMPVVLFEGENIAAKQTVKKLAALCVSDFK